MSLPLAYAEWPCGRRSTAMWRRSGYSRHRADPSLSSLPYHVGFALLMVGVCRWLWHDTAGGGVTARRVEVGLALEHVVMIFQPALLPGADPCRPAAHRPGGASRQDRRSVARHVLSLRPLARSHLCAKLAVTEQRTGSIVGDRRASVATLLAEVEEVGNISGPASVSA
ncbi:MAG: hypothetical protein R3A10_14970 [Caldilineaceae bacterium]